MLNLTSRKNTYGGLEVQLHAFLNLAVHLGDWSAPQEKSPRYPLDRCLGGAQRRPGGCGEKQSLSTAGNRTPTVQHMEYSLYLLS
jgi:hypothetical protein